LSKASFTMIITTVDSDFAKQKLRSVTKLLDSLLAGDWPYGDAKQALGLLRDQFFSELQKIENLDPEADPLIRSAHCAQPRHLIQKSKGYIGFILRSSNIRNAFEIYNPIKLIGTALFGPQHRLIVGSEWNYSPLLYPLPSQLPEDYILVGLPASEAQNALLVPTSGHELGHAIWRSTDINRRFSGLIRQSVINTYRDR